VLSATVAKAREVVGVKSERYAEKVGSEGVWMAISVATGLKIHLQVFSAVIQKVSRDVCRVVKSRRVSASCAVVPNLCCVACMPKM
jgi:hypothetical protein